MNLNTPIENIHKIGPKYAKRLHKLGIKEVKDLLFHFPTRWEDYSNVVPIKDIKLGEQITVQGRVRHLDQRNTYTRGLKIVEAYIEDETDVVKAIWFNQSYLMEALSTKNPVMLSGKVALDKDGLYLKNPIYEIKNLGEKAVHTGRLISIYPETAGVTSRWMRYIISNLMLLTDEIQDSLPKGLLERKKLMTIQTALREIHFPSSIKNAERARSRFIFTEIFNVQLAALKTKYELRKSKSPKIKTDIALIKKFVDSLPFQLTDSQKKASWQILKDMERSFPMNRLLEGDVGSGKTIVAAIAALNTINTGYQTALMAPTEILAEQHYATITSLLGNSKFQLLNSKKTPNYKSLQPKAYNLKPNIALYTRSHRKINSDQKTKLPKEKIKEKIIKGDIDFIIGTHTLAQEKVKFNKLGLVILDEQHRFGVAQRAALVKKNLATATAPVAGKDAGQAPNTYPDTRTKLSAGHSNLKPIPHLLSMTATPIPRSLALTVYGDLDISLLREMPKGRKKIITKIVPPKKRNEAYGFIKNELDKGRQAFVVFPLVEESRILELKSAKAEYEKLKEGPFKKYKVGLLHGRMKGKEKEEVMARMKEGKIQILISTSVVEVGIDIPNATIMMVDGADRFGLAQLHQFRGRVGRSKHQSYAFLLTDSSSGSVLRRLKAIEKTQSGFELAQYDLKMRGAGDMYGVRQSGMPDLVMQNLTNIELIENAREEATKLLETDLTLQKYPLLKKEIEEIQKIMHFE